MKTMTTTKAALYKELELAVHSWEEAKEQLETLQSICENTANSARINCNGSSDSKIDAMKAVWKSFSQDIAEAEYTVMMLHANVSTARKAYKMGK